MALAISILVKQQVRAHPGEEFDKRARLEELTRHHVVAEVNSRALQACAAQPKVQARRKQAIARRAATFERLRQDAGLSEGKFPRTRSYAEPLEGHGALTGIPIAAPVLHRRNFADFEKWTAVSHNQTGLVSYSDIFDATASSILAPDNANGPYFVYQELSKLQLRITLYC